MIQIECLCYANVRLTTRCRGLLNLFSPSRESGIENQNQNYHVRFPNTIQHPTQTQRSVNPLFMIANDLRDCHKEASFCNVYH